MDKPMEWVCTNPWSGCAQTHGVHGAGMGSRLHLSVHRALCCTCTHDTHTHTYTHIHTHTHIYTHIYTHVHTSIHTSTRSQVGGMQAKELDSLMAVVSMGGVGAAAAAAAAWPPTPAQVRSMFRVLCVGWFVCVRGKWEQLLLQQQHGRPRLHRCVLCFAYCVLVCLCVCVR